MRPATQHYDAEEDSIMYLSDLLINGSIISLKLLLVEIMLDKFKQLPIKKLRSISIVLLINAILTTCLSHYVWIVIPETLLLTWVVFDYSRQTHRFESDITYYCRLLYIWVTIVAMMYLLAVYLITTENTPDPYFRTHLHRVLSEQTHLLP